MPKFRPLKTELILSWCILSVLIDGHCLSAEERRDIAPMDAKVQGSRRNPHQLAKRQLSATAATTTVTSNEEIDKHLRATFQSANGNTPISVIVETTLSSNSGREISIGLTVGIALGITFCLIMAVLLVLVILWYRRKRKRNNHIQNITVSNLDPLLTARPPTQQELHVSKTENIAKSKGQGFSNNIHSDTDFLSSAESNSYISPEWVSRAWVEAKALRESQENKLTTLDQQRQDGANNNVEEDNTDAENYIEIVGFEIAEKKAHEKVECNSLHGER